MNRSVWRVTWTGRHQSYIVDFLCDQVARSYQREVVSYGFAAHLQPIQQSLNLFKGEGK